MKLLVVGLGSMGKRRVRNLQMLEAGDIAGFDVREDRCREAKEQYGIQAFRELRQALSFNPDVLVVSTPPDHHTEYGIEAAKRGIPFFLEASVVDDGIDELIRLCNNNNVVGVPSCTMRFHPAVKRIKHLIQENEIGQPVAFLYHLGQYLPDWHPHEDYRTFYVAKRKTGGCREMVSFEMEWLSWIFGGVNTVSCMKGKSSMLEIDIDDIYQILLRYQNGVFGEMCVDVVSRIQYRDLKILCENGVALWDWPTKRLSAYGAADREWHELYSANPDASLPAEEQMYVDEMAYLIRIVKGEQSPMYTLTDDKRTLELLYSAERSSDEMVHIRVK